MIYLNGKAVNTTHFPDNTTQVWKLENVPERKGYALVEWIYSHEGEVLQLAQLKELLNAAGVTTVDLDIKYLPYARQDKEIGNSSCFALRPFAAMLNLMGFDEIFIRDPHSQVAVDLIWNANPYYPVLQVHRTFATVRADMICYPDKGALTKYREIYEGFPFMWCEKSRNPLTGEITNIVLAGDDFRGKSVLIVDDICDGGATFTWIADNLYEEGATAVSLFVTHGIFSKGTRVLRDHGIKRIFTADGEYTTEQRGY